MNFFFNSRPRNQHHQHIFFISSPIVELIVASYLEELHIDAKDITLVSLRKYKPNLINAKVINIYFPFIEKVFYRLFLLSFEGMVLRFIASFQNKYFYLYTPWDVPQYFSMRRSKNCLGHFYIEEGQISHNTVNLYEISANYYEERKRLQSWRNRYVSHLKKDQTPFRGFFNNKSSGHLVLLNDAFPGVDNNKKILVKISKNLASNYVEKTSATKTIGIMPAPRRVTDIGWQKAVDIFIEKLPPGSMIKLHPGFEVNKKTYRKLESYLSIKSRGEITLCPKGTIIELEMVKAKKVLYGPLTSLKRYSKYFGSRFINLKVY